MSEIETSVPLEENPKKGMAMAITSLVLGGISIVCCCAFGLTIVPAVLGIIFAIIALVKGRNKVRIMGGIGLGVSIVGFLLALYMLISMALAINWDNVTIERLYTIENIDTSDEEEVKEWTQQFFNVPIQ